MSKELEAFVSLGSHFLMESKHYKNNDVEIITKTGEKHYPQELAGIVVEALQEKEKQDKVLQIIKRSPINVFPILNLYEDWESYKEDCDYENCLTFPFESKEEFDLLKEYFN